MATDSPTEELKRQLMELTTEQKRLEIAISQDLQYLSVVAGQPHLVIKEVASEIARDKSFRQELIAAGLNIAGRVAASTLSGKGGKAAMVANFISGLIQNNADNEAQPDIFKVITQLFKRKKDEQ